jgi:hypothetical protein
MRFIHFLSSRSIFVSLCAAFLSIQTFVLLNLKFDYNIVLLVLFATILFYNFYGIVIKWQQDIFQKNTISLQKYASNFILFILSFVFVFDALTKSPQLIKFLFIPAIASILYTLLILNNGRFFIIKKITFLKTILLAFTWAYSTVIIPASNQLDIFSGDVMLLLLIRFVFMLMIGIIFDYRDIEKDQQFNLSSLSAVFNKPQLVGLMLVLLIINSLVIWLLAFQITAIHKFILMSSTALCFLLFLLSLKKRNYYFYYFLVDGLMLFSAIASIITTL